MFLESSTQAPRRLAAVPAEGEGDEEDDDEDDDEEEGAVVCVHATLCTSSVVHPAFHAPGVGLAALQGDALPEDEEDDEDYEEEEGPAAGKRRRDAAPADGGESAGAGSLEVFGCAAYPLSLPRIS